jgi:hypothetical protein
VSIAKVHEEASSFFYLNNTFRICNGSIDFHYRRHIVNARYLSRTAASWLQKLGDRAHLIRKLELDLNGTCPRSSKYDQNRIQGRYLSELGDQGHIELAPLVCEIWKEDLNIDVSFVQTHSGACKRWLRHWHAPTVPAPGWTVPNDCFASAMTDLLRALDRPELEPESSTLNETTSLHRTDICRYWRTIGGLWVNRGGTGGILAFKTTSRNGAWHFGDPLDAESYCECKSEYGAWHFGDQPFTRPYSNYTDEINHFTKDHQGSISRTREHQPQSDKLPWCLWYKIVKYALTHPPHYKIDICNDGVLRTFGVRLVQRDWFQIRPIYMHHNSYILEINRDHTDKNAIIEGIRTLGKLLRSKPYPCWPRRRILMSEPEGPEDFATNANYQVSLCFQAAEPLMRRDQRFDMVPLLEATLLSNDDCVVTITVRNKTTNASYTTTIHELRYRAAKSWPKIDDAAKRKPCPEVWTNGYGEITEVKEFKARKKTKAEVGDESQERAWWSLKKKTRIEGRSAMLEAPVGGASYEVLECLLWKVLPVQSQRLEEKY